MTIQYISRLLAGAAMTAVLAVASPVKATVSTAAQPAVAKSAGLLVADKDGAERKGKKDDERKDKKKKKDKKEKKDRDHRDGDKKKSKKDRDDDSDKKKKKKKDNDRDDDDGKKGRSEEGRAKKDEKAAEREEWLKNKTKGEGRLGKGQGADKGAKGEDAKDDAAPAPETKPQ